MVEDGFVWTGWQSRINPLDRLLHEGVHDGGGSETCDAVMVEPHRAVWIAGLTRSAELANDGPRSLVDGAHDPGTRRRYRYDVAGHVFSLSPVKMMGPGDPIIN